VWFVEKNACVKDIIPESTEWSVIMDDEEKPEQKKQDGTPGIKLNPV